jgi:ADP-dependent NAD(P)H-hydrate dehydratase / NAD(P)H-hydrate epimerase
VQPVLTPAEMGDADRRAIASGTSEAALIERAGHAVAWHVRRALGGVYGRRAVVVCGKGNNGADGRVAARVLRGWGVGVDEFQLADGIDLDALSRALERDPLVVDAMYGTGFRGKLEGDAEQVADRIFPFCDVVAVDIPSGVDGLTGATAGAHVSADSTVCFAALKPGLLFEPGRSLAGRVEVVDIGIPVESDVHVLSWVDIPVPRRAEDDHKWSSGLFVVGGSTGMIGAPMMTSHAAARCGAGMVVCGLPGPATAARASGTEVVTRALPATEHDALDETAADAVLDGIDRFRALAIGPGLGRDAATRRAVQRIVSEAPCRIVVDADALVALGEDRGPLERRRANGHPAPVLTPHAGEYERLAGRPVGDDRLAAARALAHDTGAVVLLKGPGTVIAGPDGDAVVNTTGGAMLATAGTGDVLTGVIGGLLAHHCEPFRAAAAGAWLHGTAAEQAGTGDGLVASDLIAALPRTLWLLENGPEEGG